MISAQDGWRSESYKYGGTKVEREMIISILTVGELLIDEMLCACFVVEGGRAVDAFLQ